MIDIGKKYRQLRLGETFRQDDEMRNPVTGKWDKVPMQWILNEATYQNIGTIRNYNITFRRLKKESGK
jgi:hypothetical protein